MQLHHGVFGVRLNRWTAALAAVPLLLWGASAPGDVVQPAPSDCPSGSRPETCHGGPHCLPLACADDSTCTGGTVCREVRWCIAQIDCSGMDPTPSPVNVVKASCEGGATCAAGTCESLKVCAPAEENDGGCAWAAGAVRGSLLILLPLLLAGVVLVLRRRRG